MEKIGLNQLRQMFRDFYVSKEHYPGKSASLIPKNDNSLLIINSGMAPLKPYFAGIETPPAKRMTTCQKCIRTGDIDNVGVTSRHGTFFEMLGNFSFGDYFKEQSLTWGWEFIKDYLKMPLDKVWATVYEDDDEAVEIWKKLGMPEERIVRLGKDDNFWEIGLGPCGPCSEIYFDRGPEYGCDDPDCKPGCECDRYIEFWNHVFTQFSKEEDGSYSNLEHPNIDTGMGLERLACIMQGVDSIFDIDTIRHILNGIVEKSGVEYKDGAASTDVSIRIITDHLRSMVFMISDGINPSNEGRGYVLRRLIRRASRHGKLLGIKGDFLKELSERVIEVSGEAYPELIDKKDYIQKIISIEEEKFASTIDQGIGIIEEYIGEMKKAGSEVLDGEKAFKLHDTYGFPLELTEEIIKEQGFKVDIEGFNKAMNHQKEMARNAQKNKDTIAWDEASEIKFEGDTIFTGYDNLKETSKVIGIFNGDGILSAASVGDVCNIVLDKTPFYAEMGGQTSDKGQMSSERFTGEVLDTVKFQNVFAHKVKITEGAVAVGEKVSAEVYPVHRNTTARNHTATHLLHKALKEVVGEHVQQAGSSVTPNSLRFDFNHFEALTEDELKRIEDIVNYKIDEFLPVVTEEMSIKEASKSGAVGLFEDKYGKVVRVVSVGDYSKELCGGTHVANSGQIGAFKIVSESGVAAGVRRIEAVTGTKVFTIAEEADTIIADTAKVLKTNAKGLVNKASGVMEELKETKKEIEKFKQDTMGSELNDMIAAGKDFNGVTLITKEFKDYTINDLRGLSDQVKTGNKGIVMVFATVNDSKVTLLVSVTDDLLEKGYHAGNMIKQIAAACGGGGGGKADMAQAGAKDPSKISEAFKVAEELMA